MCIWMRLLLDGESSAETCQYERMQILGIRHPLPPTTTDSEVAASECMILPDLHTAHLGHWWYIWY